MYYDLQIGSSYNFTLYSSAILGNDYQNATVKGILDYDSAMAIQDVGPQHASIYSALPSGTPSNPKDLIYVKLETTSGEKRVIAMDWISSTPELNLTTNIFVTISGVDISKIPLVKQALKQNGFENISITTST